MNRQTTIASIKKSVTWNNLISTVFFGLIILMLIHPPVKALFMRGMMKVGFFQPDITAKTPQVAVPGEISFRDNNGKLVSLNSLRGKVVFINFWATWCPPCLAELPSINSLYNEFCKDKNVTFLISDADNDLRKSIPFIAKQGYQFPVYEQAGTVPPEICGSSIPVTIIINKKGRMIFRHEGAADYTNAQFIRYFTKLAAE